MNEIETLYAAVLIVIFTWGAIHIVYNGIKSLCSWYIAKWDSIPDEHCNVDMAQWMPVKNKVLCKPMARYKEG